MRSRFVSVVIMAILFIGCGPELGELGPDGVRWVRQGLAPTVAPTVTAPTPGEIVTTNTPAFSWDEVVDDPAVTSYSLYLMRGDTFVGHYQIDATTRCSDGACSWPLSPALTTEGGHRYWMRAINVDGPGPWTGQRDFTYTTGTLVTEAPVVSAPMGVQSTADPSFVWGEVAGATYYDLYVMRGDVFEFSAAIEAAIDCTLGECTYNAVGFADADYRFWVRGRNGTFSVGPWTSQTKFSVVTSLPGVPTPLAPTGEVSATPTFSFSAVSSATHYRIYVNAEGDVFELDTTVAASCTATTCSWDSAGTHSFVAGEYRWWVAAINGQGQGDWSPPVVGINFTVVTTVPTESPVPTPIDTTSETPTFTWTGVADASSYDIYVMAGDVYEYSTNVSAATVCVLDACSWDSTGSHTFTVGDYRFWIRGASVGGPGPWSDQTAMAITQAP